MKKIKGIILGMVFVFGMTYTIDAKTIKLNNLLLEMDCYTAFTVCDNNASYAAEQHPNLVTYEIEFAIFSNCMTGNGC